MDITRQAVMPLNYRHRAGRMSLTPLIDVVFILLVFFMLETNFLRTRSIEFAHAAASGDAASEITTIVVELHENGSVWLNGAQSSHGRIKQYAAAIQEPAKARVLLAVDEAVILQAAVDVMDIFNASGLMNMSLAPAQRFE